MASPSFEFFLSPDSPTPPRAGREAGFNPTDIYYNTLPISEYFWRRRHVTMTLTLQNINLPKLVQRFSSSLLYVSGDFRMGADFTDTTYGVVVLRPEQGVFIHIQQEDVTVHAETQQDALRWSTELSKWHMEHRETQHQPEFYLLKTSYGRVDTRAVAIRSGQMLSSPQLRLNYGSEFSSWEEDFIGILQDKSTGASVLRGEPGTGKTTFLRHLISKLGDTHLFYYLPSRYHSLLSSPDLVDFWMREKKTTDRRRVLIVEDAEALLAERANDNREAVSDVLNIADGLMGDYLEMHLIFTVNCKLDRIDPAILRRGRLVAFYEFRRLTKEEAQELADAKGLTLAPRDSYSLSEIYHLHSPMDAEQRPFVGFSQ